MESVADMSVQSVSEALAALRGALARLQPGGRIVVHGAHDALPAALAAEVRDGRTVLYLVADEEQVPARVADLDFFVGAHAAAGVDGAAVLELPAPDGSPYSEVQPDRRTIMRRMAVLARLHAGAAPTAVVSSAAGLFRKVVPLEDFAPLCVRVDGRGSLDREWLLDALLVAGFTRAPVVEDPGTFAVRGAIIDVFVPLYRQPVRIETFGDEIESMRFYDAQSQRTVRDMEALLIHPVRETLRGIGADPRAQLLAAADAATLPSSKTRPLLDSIAQGHEFFGIEGLAPIFHREMVSPLDYMPQASVIVVEDPQAVLRQAERSLVRLRQSAERRRAEHRLALDPEAFFLAEDECQASLAARPRIEIEPLVMTAASDERPALAIAIEAQSNTTFRTELQQARSSAGESDIGKVLRARIKQWLGDGQRVRVIAPGRTHAERLQAVLQAHGLDPVREGDEATMGRLSAWLAAGSAAPLAIATGHVSGGFRLPRDGLVVLTEQDIFGPRSRREATPTRARGSGALDDIQEGDLVVHEEHGVGRYHGLKKLDVRGVRQDFLHLEYDGGNVYVPVYRLGLVRRFSATGAEGTTVRLDKLGGKTWQEKKRRASAEARKLAEELLQLYAQRRALPGHASQRPDAVFREFEETFPFEETPDQARAIEAVLGDMQSEVPMDRLVCGDVGYGKTEVALRATLLAVLSGRQVAVLAPTTVLAEQHVFTFQERCRDFPVKLASLSRFRSPGEQQKVIADLAAGKLDVVIGTHRLLSRDVRFANLGLLVVDEEQRFGVAHKERLKQMRSQVDVLTLTATPIPRTLQMAMGGLREISIIATPPVDRLAIRTFVCQFDRELLQEAIDRELARGGQIFFVHNRIEDLDRWVNTVRELAPTARVAMAHGKMSEAALEKVMLDFVDGRFDILCCTTIIESGLDIPRANTMIVNRADRYGLAQLYQLRGRIGRARERAYCYLVVPEEGLSAEATQRLSVLQRFTELGAGFQIASHDLEIRGAGELLGDKQSGVMAAVGFDTYARILEEAVAELRGQPLKPETDPEVAVDLPAFLPDDYVPETGQRLDFYRRLASASDGDDVAALMEELADRFGPVPEEALLLAEVMTDKTIVRRLGALGYELGPQRLTLALGQSPRLVPGKVLALVQARGSRWKLAPDMRLSYAFSEGEKTDRLAAARARLRELETCL